MTSPAPGPSLEQTAVSALRRALAQDGVVVGLGAATMRLRSELPELAALLRRSYPDFPFDDGAGYSDATVELLPERGLRRWLRPQARIEIDGIDPFGPFPREQLLPHLEWGMNWAFANMFNSHLLLHSGALDVDGAGLLLVAQPGSGKSTLTAAMVGRGARLLSDEFGVVRTTDLQLLAVVKPVALKNESIAAIVRWDPRARFGPVYRNTRKGDLSHLAVPPESVARRNEAVPPDVIIFPRWRPGAPAELVPVAQARAFLELALNSFNYELLGATGFAVVAGLVENCDCYRLEYADLDEAVPLLFELCAEARQVHG